ncbi:outer membrane protein transport protein [Thalassotalea psychrophila]|uniref:Outer membrane protein transport protein n=1 Tax=Thalassotalea psychrophila TaxID=3065647 RepID=A0ABY9TZ49_9GAMM|nr:outer membrane protein transport protein [Colwelliaceae bacterium SQ149]
MKNLCLLTLFTGVLSSTVHASSLYLTELNTTDVSLAGAGISARAADASTAFTNPAGMTRLTEDQYEAMLMPIYVSLDFDLNEDATSQGHTNNSEAVLPSGGAYYANKVNDDFSWGLALVGYFGLGLEYGIEWAGRYYIDESILQTLGLQPSVAYKVNDKWSVGAGVVVGYSTLRQTLAVNNLDPQLGDGKITLEDSEVSYQFNFGVLYELSQSTRFGMQYLTETDLDFDDVASVKNIGPFYQGIFNRSGLTGSSVDITMTLPQSINLSAFHQINSHWNMLASASWQEWSKFGTLNIYIDANEGIQSTLEKNFDDVVAASIGGQYQWSDTLQLSFGTTYQSSMVEDKYRTPDLPLSDSVRLGFGTKLDLDEQSSLKIGYELLWLGDIKLDQERGPLTGRLAGEYKDSAMHFFSIGYSSNF